MPTLDEASVLVCWLLLALIIVINIILLRRIIVLESQVKRSVSELTEIAATLNVVSHKISQLL